MSDKKIIIQHDGAPAHTGKNLSTRVENLCSTEGWRVILRTQPPQSPDLNILDLGFFHSLKTKCFQLKHKAENMNQLIENVKFAFKEYDCKTILGIWGELFAVYNKILEVKSKNTYKLPHGHVTKNQRVSIFNICKDVDLSVLPDAFNIV